MRVLSLVLSFVAMACLSGCANRLGAVQSYPENIHKITRLEVVLVVTSPRFRVMYDSVVGFDYDKVNAFAVLNFMGPMGILASDLPKHISPDIGDIKVMAVDLKDVKGELIAYIRTKVQDGRDIMLITATDISIACGGNCGKPSLFHDDKVRGMTSLDFLTRVFDGKNGGMMWQGEIKAMSFDFKPDQAPKEYWSRISASLREKGIL